MDPDDVATGMDLLALQQAMEPIYTGGRVEVTSDGFLLMRAGNKFCLRDADTGAALMEPLSIVRVCVS
jgi:hypothetical protein